MSKIVKVITAPVRASYKVAKGIVKGAGSFFKKPTLPAAPQFDPSAFKLPSFPMMPPIVIPPPPMPAPPPGIDPNAEAERAEAATLAQKLATRGGRASTIRAGRRIAAEKQEEEGFFRKQRRASKEALG